MRTAAALTGLTLLAFLAACSGSDGDDGGGERTRLRVTETGVADLPWSDDDKAGYVEEHVHGWQVHLGDLANLLAAPAG